MARPKIDPAYEHKIADLMINEDIDKAPLMTELLKEWAKEEWEQEGWDGPQTLGHYPEERTVRRYMQKIREGKLALLHLRKRFEWPQDMGDGPEEVPWIHSRHALDCLAHYVMNYKERPMVGLTQRYVWVAISSPDWSVQQRLITAEQLWYADLIGSIPGRDRPSTVYEELRLAIKSWESGDAELLPDLANTLGAMRIVIPESDFKFLRFMPEFRKVFEKTKGDEAEKLMANDWEELDGQS